VLSQTEKSDLLRITSLLVWPGLIAPVVAPLAGGLLTTYASWRWLFAINVPLGVIAWTVAWRLIRGARSTTPPPLDVVGVLLTCAGLAAATYTAQLLSESVVDWTRRRRPGGRRCRPAGRGRGAPHACRPSAVEPAHAEGHHLCAAVGSGSLFWASVTGVPFLLTLLFQNVFGWSPVKSGAIVLFVFIGNIAIKPTTTPLLRRFGFRPVLVVATAGAAATMVLAGLFTAATPLVIIALVCVLNGVGRSVGLTGYSTIVFSDTPPEQIRDANTLQATAQQLSVGLGVPLAAVAIRAGRALAGLFGSHPGPGDAYTVAFLLMAAVVLVATAGALRLHPDAGSAVSRGASPSPESA
jgi:MFS family permease